MEITIHEHPMLPGTWEVSWTDDAGGEHIVLFGGYEAQNLALEYVAWKKL